MSSTKYPWDSPKYKNDLESLKSQFFYNGDNKENINPRLFSVTPPKLNETQYISEESDEMKHEPPETTDQRITEIMGILDEYVFKFHDIERNFKMVDVKLKECKLEIKDLKAKLKHK